MRPTSETYQTLREAVGSSYEIRVIRDETVYGMRQIKSLTIHQSLISAETGPAIGGTPSAICRLTLVEESANWPRMADFEVQFRLVSQDGLTASEWLSFGIFWTDQRREAKFGDLSITAYDGMLRLNQYWTDKIPPELMPASWPITAAQAAVILEAATGIETDERSRFDDSIAFVGLDSMATARDVWEDIAAAHGCNAVMTVDGKVRMLKLANHPDEAAIAGEAVAGLAVAGLSERPAWSLDTVELGLAMRRLDTSPALPAVTGVELRDDAGNPATAGEDSGLVVSAHCSYSDSAAAGLSIGTVRGYVYKPFSAEGAQLDPAAEIGDLADIDGESYQIMQIDWHLGAWITADLSAPAEYEIDHEYRTAPEAAVTLHRALDADERLDVSLRSYIRQTATEILQGIAAQYVSDEALQDVVDQLQVQIDGAIETWSGAAVPTPNNYPASGWTSREERGKHLGDLYIVSSEGGDNAGSYYRYELSGSAYGWTLLKDADITRALEDAEDANERAAAAQQTAATLQQTLEDVYSPTAVIEDMFATKDENLETRAALQSEISQTESSLTVAMGELSTNVSGQIQAMAYYIRYENGVVIIVRTDSPTTIRVSNTQIGIWYGNEPISYWNNDKQLSPKQLEVPVGGSLKLGSVIWQPRSSGNLSLMWVGAPPSS